MFLLAVISLSLGIINLFPFLPLDGGHIFWALAEKVRGRAIPFSVMERAGFIGFALVIGLFVIGLTNDIGRLTGEGFRRQVGSRHGGARPLRPARRSLGARTMTEAFRLTVEDNADRVAVRTKDDEVSLTWAQLRDRVDALAGGLAGLGVRRGDTVALMLVQPAGVRDRRPRGDDARRDAVLDLPDVLAGRRSPTSSATRPRAWRSSRSSSSTAFRAARAELPALEHVIVVEGERRGERHDDAAGRTSRAPTRASTPSRTGARSSRTTCVTLIYTSGTTGPPKGVELAHRNLLAGRARGRRDHPLPRRLARDLVAARPRTSPSGWRTTTCRSCSA